MHKNSRRSRIITFGTFDLFHIGHLNLLERARALGGTLTVGVSTDALNYSKKSKYPIYPQEERFRIISALRCVDQVFYEESLELKPKYLREWGADVLVMGEDWKGRFDEFRDLCEVVYLPRTDVVSTTAVEDFIKTRDPEFPAWLKSTG